MDSLSKYVVLMVGHGSRRREYNEDVESGIEFLKANLGLEVRVAYNEYSMPNWREELRKLVKEGYTHIIFSLAFLGRGNHVYKDIMSEIGVQLIGNWEKVRIEDKEVRVYITEPIGKSPLVWQAILYRVIRALEGVKEQKNYIEDPEEIEENSLLNIIQNHLGNISDEKIRRILAKIIFASGNPELVKYSYISKNAIESGLESLKAGVDIVADVKMVAVGIRWRNVICKIDSSDVIEESKFLRKTRAAVAIRKGIGDGGKIVVIGNSPTALIEVLRIVREGKDLPLVIATPPGFTNAVEAKEELVNSGIPAIVVRGTYGGSGIAVAIINELINMIR